MARVLVLEDEDRYREVVARYLSLQGHSVRDTATGEEAIALGLAQPPDVLVADWMLRHSVHGLHVAEALRVADPALHTVLVTGFPASDVTVDPGRVGIWEILEKPFDMDALDRAVRNAGEAGRAVREGAIEESDDEVVGVLRCDPDGTLVHRNRAAAALLADWTGGREVSTLAEIVPEGLRVEAGERWVELPGGAAGGPWLRVRRLGEGGPQVALLATAGQAWRREDPRVRMLLGQGLGASAEGVFRDAMLLVDDSSTVRDTFVKQLAHRGCSARSAGRHAEAIDLFRADPRIRVVVLDWAMPGEDLRTTEARLREIRPEVRLVGTSGEDRSAEFAELGIDDFLLKPWTVAGELAALLGEELPSRPSRENRG
jgi:two-component system OmpR family response regulator